MTTSTSKNNYIIKINKSTACDIITVSLVKNLAQEISQVLSHINNLIVCGGIFPESLKKNIVIHILKKSNSFKFKNLRPISLLSNLLRYLRKQ